MILKALADYYQRLLNDPDIDIAPFGFENKEIPFILVIDSTGKFKNIIDTRTSQGTRQIARKFCVPKGEKKTSGIKANLLWDVPKYSLGIVTSNDEKAARKKKKNLSIKEQEEAVQKIHKDSIKQHQAFKQKLQDAFAKTNDIAIKAVLNFLISSNFSPVQEHPFWSEIDENGGNLTFQLEGDTGPICQRAAVVQAIIDFSKPNGKFQICAVTGQNDVPAELHTAIKKVWGAKSSGANIVSFNLDAVESFGKKQGYNAPVGQTTEFAYTTALNYLLASNKQRTQVGDASTVFWAKEPCDLENDFYDLIGQPHKGEEKVSYEKIRSLLAAVKTGIPPEEENIAFYVLGLAPNASRIAIRFWYEGNVKELKERIAQHFEDIEIVRAPHDPEYLSLFQLLLATATESKADNISPNLGGEVARAVLSGTIYPRTMLSGAIRRGKAEQRVTFARASIIKGFLARHARITGKCDKEVSMALDKTYDNIGYVLGRLFAVLERIQEQAQGAGLNKTIRDTYFGAASSSPLVTFRRLQDLAIHHLAKIRNSGKSTVWLEKLLGEVENLIPPQGIPAILDLEDQGRFAVGYYHQRQDFFKTKDNQDVKGVENE